MNKNKKDNDTKNKDRIKRIIDTVRKDLASRPKEWKERPKTVRAT